MSRTDHVVDTFYDLSEIAERVGDEAVGSWLAALVLLLSEEVGDADRVAALAEKAAAAVQR